MPHTVLTNCECWNLSPSRSVPSLNTGQLGGSIVSRRKKYYTEEARREARRQDQRKYVAANREAVNARQAVRDRMRSAAAKAKQKNI